MTDRENEIQTPNYNCDKHAERQLKKMKKKEKMRNKIEILIRETAEMM
jgi:hypothetical protein